ncbi:MAG: hypothetical protein AAGC81_14095 [Pseudomonadota bacterium]
MAKQKDTESVSDQDLDDATGGAQQGRMLTDADFNTAVDLSAERNTETKSRSGVIARKVGMTRLFHGG